MPLDAPNPERRSDAAILCLLIGAGLIGLAWLLGLGGILAMAMSGAGAGPGVLAGGLASLIVLPLTAAVGFVLLVIGAIWLFVRVVADSREDHARDRYRDVER